MVKRLLSLFALLLMLVTSAWADGDMKTVPLTLEAKTAGTIVVSNPQSGMQYSLNGGAKTEVTSAAIDVIEGDKVQFFGNNSIVYNNKNTDISDDTRFTGDADCFIYGNIMSLVDAENYSTATELTADSIFCGLFRDNTHLYNHATNDLVLPATTLSAGCYRALLRGCTNLTKAPTLPATTLADYCYSYMFFGCAGLTAAPALPATTLADYCYYYMFYGCAGLTSVPSDLLPASTAVKGCYSYMFVNCSSLTAAPALPATTLAKRCYRYMFSGCTNLTTAPTLPAENLADSCYASMFRNCVSLTSAPALPATTLASNCYHAMFWGCGLTSAPTLPATTLTQECYRSMFYGCTNLTTAPALPVTTLAERCYYTMFTDCSKLNSVTCLATDISATEATNNWLSGVAATGTFIKAEGMTSWPRTVSGIPSRWAAYDNNPLTLEAKTAGTIVVSNHKSGMKYSKNGGEKTAVTSSAIDVAVGDKVQFFGNGTSITSYDGTQIGGTAQCYIYGLIMSLVDEENFATATTLTAANAFRNLFSGNSNLYNHDTKELGLSAMTLTEGCYNGMFSGCTNLTSAPVLRVTTLTNACYQSMFSGCTGLTTAPALPATTLANACYQSMFSGCTGLTTAPALPATTLEDNCYKEMFNGCTSLNAVTCYATDISATDATTNWLKDVAATGTFTKNEATPWTIDSPDGIPSGWSPTDDPQLSPLTLVAKTDGTIVVSNPQSGMQYKKNGGEKIAVTSDAISVAVGDKVQFFGDDTSITNYYTSDKNYTNIVGGTAECYIYGNIMSLVDEENYATATTLTGANAFRSLFNGNANLYNHDTKELLLPATKLSASCYRALFSGCTNLTKVPALPATTMISYCYSNMFSGCTGLTSLPSDLLPATTLKDYCYSSMFSGCTGLTSLPSDLLPATALATYCYQYMFSDCTGLTSVPALPATKLASYCYYYMFSGCTGLTSLPADLLPATTLANRCYGLMFRGCTGLKTLPAGLLPATTLADRCYYSMFNSCTSLETVPADLLPATTLANYCYQNMFNGCTKLKTAPELPAKTLVSGCYYQMFYNCSSLNSVTCLATDISANNSHASWLNGVADEGTFTKASKMTGWPTNNANGIPSGWTVKNKAILNDNNDIASQLTAGQECIVEYKRAFTEYKPSTVCLPFDYAKKDGEKFYSFTGVGKDGEGNFVATMTEYTGDNLVANTPYLYVSATTGETDFSGTYTLPAAIEASTTTSGDWKFVGTYTTQTWETAPTGIYGFSAQNTESGISKGEFVKVGAYVRVKPMRSYLKYMDGSEDYHNASARGFGNTTDSESLPERIKVRFVDADGTVTGIGTLNTQTGEVSFDSEAWYTQDGIRLSAKPTKKGIYVNNGKKVMVK